MDGSRGKQPVMPAGMSPASQQQSQEGPSQGSTSLMPRISGSTAFTTAVGRLVRIRFWASSSPQAMLEENTLAEPSLPKRMARLSNTARPLMDTGRAPPTKASAVTR